MDLLFFPFPKKLLKRLSSPLRGVGEMVQRLFFPRFDLVLEQSNMRLTPDEFFSMTVFVSLFYGILAAICLSAFVFFMKISAPFLIEELLGLIIAGMVFFRIVMGSAVSIHRKVSSIEANLIFGLKMILVEINSGVSLFDSIVIVATHDLGEMSIVFKEIAKRMNSGEQEDDVLKDIATRNPSPFLRKVLWQIVSGLKAGASLNKVIDESLRALERQQKIDIISYGSSLRVLTLIFMMIGVIVPAMGLAFLFVLNSLPGLNIQTNMLWLFLLAIGVFQFMLVGFIKSKRPNLMGSV